MPEITTSLPSAPVRVNAADTPGVQGLLTLAVGVVIVAGLYIGREVIIPIILAILLAFLLAPLVSVLRQLHLGRVASALLAVAVALGIILAFGAMIGTQLAELAQDVPRYASSIERKVEALQTQTFGRMTTIMKGLGRELDRANTAKDFRTRRFGAYGLPGERAEINASRAA